YNIGYTARQIASIDGYVFKDNNYNGKYDLRSSGLPSSSDTPISGVRIGLKRYVLVDEATNTWEEANNDQEYYRTIRTDRNGRYNFNDLPTHREAGEYGDIPLLYGYTVWLIEMPKDANGKPLAATYYQYNHERYDSALIADTLQIIKDDQGYNGPGEYYNDENRLTIIADPVDEDDTLQYVVSGYNIVQGMSRWAYSVGLVDYQKATINGNVFDDSNYSGLIDEENPRFDNFEIGLKRYKLIDGEWLPAQPEDEEYFEVVSTNENGDYVFNNLDIYTEEDDKNILYGYDLYVVNAPIGYEITKYQVNNGSEDSAVRLDNHIIKQDLSLDEMYDGKLVLADKNERGVNHTYLVDGYDIVRANNLEDYNAGYIEQRLGTISGTVFDDESYDGILDNEEDRLSDVEVTLKRFIYDHEEWVEDTDYVNTVSTDKNGNYIFENLETYTEKDGEKYLCGYEVWVTEQPDGYVITRYQNDSKVLLNGHIIKPDTRLDEVIDGKIVVASKVEKDTTGIDPSYIIDGRNIVLAENITEYDAGYKAQEKGIISGIVFDDKNYDGNIDNEDGRLKNVEVTLKRFIYTKYGWTEDTAFDVKALTDENGAYSFDNLETYVANEDGKYLYGYEVWVTDAPDGYAITRYKNDSYVLLNGQIIKPDKQLPEMLEGKIVVAEPAEDRSGIDRSFIIQNYNVVLAENISEYNAGYIKEQRGSISGKVFDDKNFDGAFNEEDTLMPNVGVTLKRFVYANSRWTEDTEFDVTALTDKDGAYIFDNLNTYVVDEYDEKHLYGYEVWVTDAPNGYAITRYQIDSYVLLNGQIIKPDTELPEMLNGKIVVAEPVEEASGVDESFIVENYNVVLAEDITEYNAGYIKAQKGSISGKVFDDKNYDGAFNEDDSLMPNVEVTLKRFVYANDEWTEDTEFAVKALTGKNGAYLFNDLDTYVADADGNHLYGYEVWVTGAPEGYAITRYKHDSYVLLNGQIIKPDTKLPEMLDGKIVVAEPVDDKSGIDESFIIEDYNVVLAEDITEYNAGYVKAQKGSISGKVFNDISYDGVLDVNEPMMADVEVTLKRFVYENGEWTEDTKFNVKALTDKAGAYRFNNLDTYVADEDGNHLYGYEVWVTDAPKGYAVTKYVNDSHLLVNGQIIKPDTKLPEMLDGKIVVAEPVDHKSGIDPSFIIKNYNIVFADNITDYNAGYKLQEFASISGNAFDDIIYNGLIDADDNMLSNIQIGLKRFVYENGEWTLAQNEGEEYYQTTATSENGGYIFDNLETYVNADGVNKLYGYELYVIGIDDRFATKYQMNDGNNDSALVADSKQIIKKDSKLSEMLDGKLVLAKPVGNDVQNTPYVVEDYDVVQGVNLTQYNAGLVPVREYSISGYVWNDMNRDGFINENEKYMSDVNVTLERLYFYDGQWRELPQEEAVEDTTDAAESEIDVQNEEQENPNVAVTDKNGYYVFNNLPLYTVVDGNRVVCGYRVKIEELPSKYAVTVLHANNKSEDAEETALYDNDLNDKTGYLEDPDALIILAEKADKTTPDYYNIDNFNISYGESVEHLDAGVVPFGVGSIAGVLFEDANENG
ncbi:MAG: hypothetical protein K2F65_01930, partial [Eubacterium sp.]|nr:hypothetical protein [Eubacterium sp.]